MSKYSKFLSNPGFVPGFRQLGYEIVLLHALTAFCLLRLINHACHTATHNTEEDNSKHVVNRSETMTLRKEGEGGDSSQCPLLC